MLNIIYQFLFFYVKINIRIKFKEFFMNENPGGTPNPLNPSPSPMGGSEPLDANPSDPAPQSEVQNAVTEPQPVQGPAPVADTNVVNPMDRPMEKAPEKVEEPKKKKTGLIVGVLVCLLVAVACGVAAMLLIFNGNGGDQVTAALKKLMSNDTPKYVAMAGDISIKPGSMYSEISEAKVNFNANFISKSMVNSFDASFTAVSRSNGSETTLGLSEIYSEDGNVYLKISGAANLINSLYNNQNTYNYDYDYMYDYDDLDMEDVEEIIPLETDETILYDDEYVSGGSTLNDVISVITSVVKSIDNKWIKISTDELNSISGGVTYDQSAKCLVDFVNEASANSNSIAELYSKNPFITSSTEDMKVTSRRDTIYKIGIDSEKFVNYVESVEETELFKNFASCVGNGNSVPKIDKEEVDEMAENLPEIYVEINNDNLFTRFYVYYENERSEGVIYDGYETFSEESDEIIADTSLQDSATIDLTFDYPTTINISAPVDYTNFTEIFQQVMSSWR